MKRKKGKGKTKKRQETKITHQSYPLFEFGRQNTVLTRLKKNMEKQRIKEQDHETQNLNPLSQLCKTSAAVTSTRMCVFIGRTTRLSTSSIYRRTKHLGLIWTKI